jgi:hypothetical protein
MPAVLTEYVRLDHDANAFCSAAFHAQRGLENHHPDSDADTYAMIGARLMWNQLPLWILERISDWRRAPTPWFTVENLPQTPEWVPTPQDGFCDESLLTVVNLVQLGMLRLLGLAPVAYRWENNGRLIRNVAPRPGFGRARTSWGYSASLDWHTDDSVLDHHETAEPSIAIPHYLSFYGMRNDEAVPTDLLPVSSVVSTLPEWVVAHLRLPEFLVTAPESYAWGPADGPMAREAVPLLWTLPGGDDAVRYGPGRISGLTLRAARALSFFERRLGELDGVPVLLDAGDFHIFDNRRVLHRRVPFQPAAPGAARWLRRCYAQRTPQGR